MEYDVYLDGSCTWDSKYEPLESTCSFIVKDSITNKNLYFGYYKFSKYSNNVMEVLAFLKAISFLKSSNLKISKVNFFSDSSITCNYITNLKGTKHHNLRKISNDLVSEFKNLNFKYTLNLIPRELNQDADRLASLAHSHLKSQYLKYPQFSKSNKNSYQPVLV